MKIAFLNIDTSLGGASTAAVRLANSLISNHSASISQLDFFVGKNEGINLGFVKVIGSSGFASFRLAFEKLAFLPFEKNKKIRFGFSMSKVGVCNQHLKHLEAYDIIHIHWYNLGFLSLNNLKYIQSLGKPVVFTLHDMWLFTGGCHYSGECVNFLEECGKCYQYLRKPEEGDLSFRILKEKINIFDGWKNIRIVTCSIWLKELASKSSLLKDSTVLQIPNTLSTQIFKSISQKEARQKLGINPNAKKLILFTAMNTSDKRKGFDLLQKALSHLSNSKNEYELLIVGRVKEEVLNDLPFRAHTTGLLATEKEMNLAYNAADVFAMPSREDNLPNSIMESLAVGLPIVCFSNGGMPEMVDHLKSGYVAKSDSITDFSDGLQWLLNSNTEEIKANCLANFKRKYNELAVSTKYLNCYKDLVGK